ncbi:MAG: hypothetical protein AABZ70_15465 [candidate division NC10 bacterium]
MLYPTELRARKDLADTPPLSLPRFVLIYALTASVLGIRGPVHVKASAPGASCVRRQWLANERTSRVRQLASLAPPANGGSSPVMQASLLSDQLSQWPPDSWHQAGVRQSNDRRQAGCC